MSPIGGSTSHWQPRVAREPPILFTMIDLDASYGRSLPVRFLGDDAHLVAGPYLLALRRRAAMLFVDRYDGDIAFDPPSRAGSARRTEASSLAQRFAHRMEHAILTDPARWGRCDGLPALRAAPPARTC
ncbi:MAG: hypothetical protein HC809_07615 [Gammaproteobacteria bacterium]|nr:hypothetical protein [Gammaproteobacteria bacterium]